MTEKRFTEIISIQKVIDDETGKEYDCLIDDELLKLLNELNDENDVLKQQLKTKYIVNKQYEELMRLKEENKELKKEKERLKQEKFICLDCKYSGYTEIGCLCEKKDHWTDYKTECEDYEGLWEDD